MTLLRTLLFIPGNNMKMIQKAGSLMADAIIFDLEDSVPAAEKETARVLVRDAIGELSAKDPAAFVRVNGLTTGLMEEDLNWVVQKGLAGVVLPKVESRDDISKMSRLMDQVECKKGIGPGSLALIPILETAIGVINAHGVSKSCQRVAAVAFGAVDFAREMGITPSEDGAELLYARSRIAIGARAAGVQAVDSPWINVADMDGLVQQASAARRLGFRGKFLIHPRQIEPVNRVFSPTKEEVDLAERVTRAFRIAEARGLGVTAAEGTMIDRANFRQAEELLALHLAIVKRETQRRR